MPRPPAKENKTLTWPDWPLKLRTSSSHEEGCERDWAVVTKRAIGSNGKIEALECVRIEWVKSDDGRMEVKELPGSEFQLKADLVLLAMGFLGPRKAGMIEQSGVGLDSRGNVAAKVVDYKSSVSGVFSFCHQPRRQALDVLAFREGRKGRNDT